MKRLFILVAVMLSLVFSSAAFAADAKGYFALKGGIFDPNGKTDGLEGFDNGSNFEVAYGMKVHQNITLEFGAGHYDAEHKADSIKVSAIPLTLTGLVNIPLSGAIDLNAGAGFGYYFTKLEDTTSSLSIEEGAVGYQVVAGLDFKIGQAMSIGIEGKYVSVKPEFDTTSWGGSKEKVEAGGMMYNAVLKFKF